MTAKASLTNKESGAFYGGAVSWRERLSIGADGNIPLADFVGSGGSAHTIGGRLCLANLAQAQNHQQQEQLTRVHCEWSHRWPPSKGKHYCLGPLSGAARHLAHSSISRSRLAWVAQFRLRLCSVT